MTQEQTNNFKLLAALAQELAEELSSDIRLATHREEHVRVTARANKAAELANGLRSNK
jgi:hypothetical protein